MRKVKLLRGVAKVIPISKLYKMASRDLKHEGTIAEVGNTRGQAARISTFQLHGGYRRRVVRDFCTGEIVDHTCLTSPSTTLVMISFVMSLESCNRQSLYVPRFIDARQAQRIVH